MSPWHLSLPFEDFSSLIRKGKQNKNDLFLEYFPHFLLYGGESDIQIPVHTIYWPLSLFMQERSIILEIGHIIKFLIQTSDH